MQLDKRFARVLDDADFSKKPAVDRYGRRLPEETGRKELERLYHLDDDDGEDSEAGQEDEQGADNDEEVLEELSRVGRAHDPARGGGFSESEDSSEDEDDFGDDEHAIAAFPDTQIDQPDVPMGEISPRLAVVNLDWDNIRAVDLMAVFASFCPPSGRITRVAVYPSEFGKARMEREEMEGPPREIFASAKGRGEDDDSSDDAGAVDDDKIKDSLLKEDTGEEFDGAKLRQYQLERLRYFYAVLTLSSSEAAKALYDATDGTEYLTTANFFDLRFIPDHVTFDNDVPRDECTAMPDAYKPNAFVTDALQHSKVKLTWDAEDGARKEAVKKAFGGSRADIEENDLKAYLGSDSSEGEGGEGNDSRKDAERKRLRAALGLADAASTKRGAWRPRGRHANHVLVGPGGGRQEGQCV